MPFHFSDTCDEEQTERIVSHSSFQLKGSCWYKDGYTKPTQKTNLQNEISDLRLTLDDTKKQLRADANKEDK